MTNRARAEQTAIGPWLLVPILIIAALSQGMLNEPRYSVIIMGNNAYWAFPIATLFFVIPAMAAIYLLAKRFPGQSIIEQGKSILGPVFGAITGLGYLGFLLLFLAMFVRDIVNLASLFFLFTTPVYALALIYLLAAAYLASRGIETITRTASFVVIPALLFILLLSLAGFHNVSWNNLKPVFTPNLFNYLKGANWAMQNFYMLGLAAMILPYLKPLQSFPRFAGGVILLLLFFFSLITIGTIGVYGPEYLLKFAYPSFEFFRAINIPYLLLEQVGMIIGIAWLVMILMGTSFGHYAMSLGLSQIIPLRDYKLFVWLLVPFEFIVIMLPSGVLQTKVMVDLISHYGWISLFGYPLFLWLIAVIFKRKGVKTGVA